MADDEVTRPKHYGGEANPHEPIKVIEHYDLGFCLGNAVKYILRSDKKGSQLDDLKKARWYIDREIKNMEGEANPPIIVDRLTRCGKTVRDATGHNIGGCHLLLGHSGDCE